MRNFLILAVAASAMLACTPADKPASEGSVASSGIPTAKQNCGNRSSSAIGGPFHLTSHTGSPTTEESLKGRKSFVFFGFTHCPDVCPITLYNVGKAISRLPAGKQAPRTVFISVDPARDTPDAIAQYIQSNGFPKDIIGLTGTLDELEQIVSGFKTTFSRDEDADSAAGYLVSHSSILYLMDEDWKLQTFFTDGAPAQEIADCIASLS